ncbi:MAG: maleylpyruvate isomerase family mycothiol-dependent enzyme [Chloroflexota bacterium]
MTTQETLATIESEGQRLVAFASRAPDRVVPHYPTWTLRDLVSHVASVHARTTIICTTLPQTNVSAVRSPKGRDPFDWYAETLPEMIGALRVADADADVWTLFEDRSLATWQRRMLIETSVHRWDAQQAIEEPQPLPSIVSGSGLDEFSDLWLPKLGSVPVIEVTATDLGRSWQFGSGDPVASASDSGSKLYLRLMARPGARFPSEWEAAVDAVPSPAG